MITNNGNLLICLLINYYFFCKITIFSFFI
uniref:DNA topoisomerase family protein n=1 Tax=Rhizophora mucronata TaxID=61149 RepID=A0A2P2LZ68_RHIMU